LAKRIERSLAMIALALTADALRTASRPPVMLPRSRVAAPSVSSVMLYREPKHCGGEVYMTIRRLLKQKGSYVPSIGSDATVREVLAQLDVDNVGALVVTDDDEKILGLISERDIVRGLKQDGIATIDAPVSKLMSTVVYTCDVNEPLSKVLELMDRHQFRHVPIKDGNRLCGIINMLDVAKYRLEELRTEAEALKEYVAGRA
jgi:CBS domain-containing protein